MNISTSICDICQKTRHKGNHEKCSKIRQARGLLTKRKPAQKSESYNNDRKLSGFLRTLG